MKRKILGMTAAIAVIISLLVVTLPAEEKDNECGCCCNKASTEGKPLNFYDLIEKTKGWEEDVILLEKELKEKKEKLLELYKQTKEGIQWKEIENLQSEIEKLETEYWYKKEILFEISVLRKYTELQEDGTLKIVKESLPEVNDFEVDKALNTMEFVGEEKMEIKLELYKTLFGEDFKENMQNLEGYVVLPYLNTIKLEELYQEMIDLDDTRWNYEKKYIELIVSQKMKKVLSRGIKTIPEYCRVYSNCDPPDAPLTEGGEYEFLNLRKIRVWVGVYSTETPNMAYKIGDLCYTYFTTSMHWYYAKAKQKYVHCRSIQVKWFYLGEVSDNNWKTHNLIREGNKSSNPHIGEWYTYGRYTTTNPENGDYVVTVNANWLQCCYNNGWHWCNTHCHGCFACDQSRAQNFSLTDTQ